MKEEGKIWGRIRCLEGREKREIDDSESLSFGEWMGGDVIIMRAGIYRRRSS